MENEKNRQEYSFEKRKVRLENRSGDRAAEGAQGN